MKIKTFEFNPLSVNTYVLSDETRECVVIDAACFYPDEKEMLLNYLIDNDLIVKRLINTHLHFDHLFGVNFLASHFGLPLDYHPADEFLLEDIPGQLRLFGFQGFSDDLTPPKGLYLYENDTVTFGRQQLRVWEVPGHSPGSIVFYSAEDGALFSGDALFRASIGRTDLARGDYEQLIDGIKKKLFVLPDETIVYPGHGPSTTIGFERRNNPFLQSDKSN
ncbi:MAG TPA: MBL fold hydrolase [Porphyromonadaceae bacterium]|nr:MBL fold hydrolase [Porphyromonadaceae bacterium]